MVSENRKTALIIDDSDFMRAMVRSILVKNGFHVAGEAKDGKIGIEKFKSLNPDIVVTDILMEGTSGFEVIEEIKKHNPDAKIVVVSSVVKQKPYADELLAKGASVLVPKPVLEDVLTDAIDSIM